MKRFVLALICGLLWPALLLFSFFVLMPFDGTAFNWLARIMVQFFYWPGYLLVYIFPTPLAIPGTDAPRIEVFIALWLIHAVSFALPFYLVLRWFARPRWR
jgi:hypothetical protein